MAKKFHTEETIKKVAVRAGKRITYQGKKLDLRELMFALYCRRNGLNPWNGTPLTSNKGGAS